MPKGFITREYLENTADAIRVLRGESSTYTPAQMSQKILDFIPEKTVTGSTVSVSDAAAYPAVGLTVNIEPVQEGSGDPSLDNIRPIIGWTGVNIYQSGADTSEYATIPVAFSEEAGIVYGGVLDVENGTLTKNTGIITMTGTGYEYSPYRFDLYVRPQDNALLYLTYLDNTMVKQYPNGRYTNGFFFNCAEMTMDETILSGSSRTMAYTEYGNYGDSRCHVIVRFGDNFNFDTKEKVNNWVQQMYNNGTPVQYCYPLKNSVTYQLTPTQIEMLLGDNSIWAEGNVSLTYKVDLGRYIQSLQPVSANLSMGRSLGSDENSLDVGDVDLDKSIDFDFDISKKIDVSDGDDNV